MAGLQAQEPRAPYIGLWTRLHDFDRDRLTRALHDRRVVKATLMRGTLHLVSARDYDELAPALLAMIETLARRHRPGIRDVQDLARRALAFADRPRSNDALRTLVGGGDEWALVRAHAPFIRAPTGPIWAFGPRVAFVSAEAWLGASPGPDHERRVGLLRRYLAAFGPASLQDAAAWSGLTVAALRPAAEALAPRLRRLRDERGRELLDLRGAPLPAGDTRAPPRLLPPFDNAILSHADRTRIVSDEHRRILIRGGLVDPVFLVDGFVAGRWRLQAGGVALEPFVRLPRTTERALRREGELLAAFLDAE